MCFPVTGHLGGAILSRLPALEARGSDRGRCLLMLDCQHKRSEARGGMAPNGCRGRGSWLSMGDDGREVTKTNDHRGTGMNLG